MVRSYKELQCYAGLTACMHDLGDGVVWEPLISMWMGVHAVVVVLLIDEMDCWVLGGCRADLSPHFWRVGGIMVVDGG